MKVLVGALPAEIAGTIGLTTEELITAADLFRNAGREALQTRAEHEWYHVSVEFPDWASAEHIAVTNLAPSLRNLTDTGAISAWWFLRKYPSWRLRLRPPPGTDPVQAQFAVNARLEKLRAAGAIESWRTALYEAETYAFGGPAGMLAAHDHFCSDSLAVFDYLSQPVLGLGRRELTLLLCKSMFNGAGLDWFEMGDVWNTIAELRPLGPTPNTALQALTSQIRGLLHADTGPNGPLFADGVPLSYATTWILAFDRAGQALRVSANAGTLSRGLRHVLAHLVIFHWNRLGLPTRQQALLTHAAREATLPRI